jgi:uncharacterized protein
MLLRLHEIINVPGSSIPFSYEADLRDVVINYSTPFVNPVQVTGEVNNIAGVLHMKMKCDTLIRFECDRCTEQVERPYSITIETVLVEFLEDPEDIENADIVVIEDATVDTYEVVRSNIILESDMKLLCSSDCKGLCPRCGSNLNEGPCDCGPEIDPRFEKLKDLLK